MLQNFDIGQFFDPRGINFIIIFIALAVIVMMKQKSLTPGVLLIPLAFIISFSFNVYYRFARGDVFTEIFDPRGANFTPALVFIGVALLYFKKFGVGVLTIVVGVSIPQIVIQYDDMLGSLYRMSLIHHDLLFHQIYVWLFVIFAGGMILSGILLIFVKQKKAAWVVFVVDVVISAVIWISYYVELGFYEKLGNILEVQIIEGEILAIISLIAVCYITNSRRKNDQDTKTSVGNPIHAQSAQKRIWAVVGSLTAHIIVSFLFGDIVVTIGVPVGIIFVYIMYCERDIWENIKDSILAATSSIKELLPASAKNLEIENNEINENYVVDGIKEVFGIEGINENHGIKGINVIYGIGTTNKNGIGEFDELTQLNRNLNRKGVTLKEQNEMLEKSFVQQRLHAIKFEDKKVVSPRPQANNTIKFNDEKVGSLRPHANNTIKFDGRKVISPKMESIKQKDPLSAYNTLRSQLKNSIIEMTKKREKCEDLSIYDLKTVISKGRAFLSSKGIQIENNVQKKIQDLTLIHVITRENGRISDNIFFRVKTLINEINKEFKNKFYKIKWKMDSEIEGKTDKIDGLNQTVKEDDIGYENNPK